MGLSIEEILLQVRSDGDQARRDLQETAAELNGFDRQEAEAELRINSANAKAELEGVRADLASFARESAEATADVDTTRGKAVLDDMQRRLSAIDREDISPEVEVKIAKALIDVEALHARLEALDREDVTVDVDVKRGVVERFSALAGQVGALSGSLGGAAGGAGGGGGLISSLGEAAGEAEVFGMSLGRVALAAPLVIGIVGALVTGLALLVSSLAEAALGVGALAVAFGATLLPAIALAVGAIANFKDGGPVVDALKKRFEELGDVFKNTLAPASHAVFKGLLSVINDMLPVIRDLRPAFTTLGKAVGSAFRTLGREFSSKPWERFFSFVTRATARLVPSMTQAFINFARVMRNIARAAMPFVIEAFRDLAHWMRDVARRTSDIGALRKNLRPLVQAMQDWLKLIGAVSRIFLGFMRDASPAAHRLMTFLAQGADAIADWLNTKEGQQRMHQFFNRVVPLVKELVKFTGRLFLVFAEITEIVAPGLANVVWVLNRMLDVLIVVLDWVNKVGHSWKVFGDAGKAAVGGIKDVLSTLAAPAIESFGHLRTAARNTWKAVKGIVSDTIRFVLKMPGGVGAAARKVWDAVRGVIRDVITFIFRMPGGMIAAARGVWNAVQGVIKDTIRFVLDLPPVQAIRNAAQNIWDAANNALGQTINLIIKVSISGLSAVLSGLEKIKNAAGDALGAVKGAATGRVIGGGPTGSAPSGGPNFGGLAAAVGNAAARSVARAAGAPLARGTLAASGGALAAAGPTYHETIHVTAIEGGMPDPEQVAGRIALRRRQRGRR